MRRTLFNGNEVDTEVMEFETIKPETWAVFKLSDGTLVRAKLTVQEIIKLHGEYSPNGEPVYQVIAGTVLSSQALEENLQHNQKKLKVH
jgi:hypothetical protein